MSTEIFIISGFLGAGKTTLIQKLLKEAFQNEKIVLIENDFGDISVDAALLKSGGIEVKEINSGCICCSLSGDFIKSLKELLERFNPDKVIIEPSGVGKLSDIIKACLDPRILSLAKVKAKITVADVKRCKMYLDNFGEFFEDQIQNADAILLSRTEEFPDRVNAAYEIIRGLNPHGAIFSKPWGQINVKEILHPHRDDGVHAGHHQHAHECKCGCSHNGAHSHGEHKHGHGHNCSCGHNHGAEEIFDTVTIRTNQVFSIEDLKARISNMEKNARGTILRAKGILRGPVGYMNLQYLPGDIKVTECTASGDMLCIIGRNLNRQELCSLFSGE
ncbi:putative GTP-binding protein YjiA [Oxobacter pfennigii]|uniref:Putative GTP-binding protein YjiA n=1 Tax=Oxobacter pfennigii TaxID=36849 RepID=A0A0P8WZF6_9CLOT|nr:CobW family GTP-binding protein [Oxobacter pfennigii]KPU43862.1 putative GTP-binding protein YjiA [Oxobacter pfennigii]